MAKEKIGKLLGELLFFPLDCEQSERFSKEKKTFPFRFFFVAIVRRILETDQVCYSVTVVDHSYELRCRDEEWKL